ncbi:hypothetical protein SGFS_094960 [Streptomyces graminofaciens]|jgi:hypothetical protein|uniref:TIR domain-containing protein n=1 Tax=Streptomyces graminofaciens TaxID=68212 RepID=A0ABN5VXM1_9ACTN|nr:hypothetical protein [Streptomyces graminofaciens]BBC38202.1 hypothetical protein SGFS_094960 [Streptomyces graminofaciens]
MPKKLKVFVSWSGEPSRRCALLLREKLPIFNHLIEPFVSSEDIAKGVRGLDTIAAHLAGSQFGIVCVTPANRHAPWINYESGALSREVGKDRLAPFLLLGATVGDLVGTPLMQFQATRADHRDDVLKMVKSINELCDPPADGSRLASLFDMFWPELEEGLKQIPLDVQEEERSSAPPRPSAEEIQSRMLSQLQQQGDRLDTLVEAVSALRSERASDLRKGRVLFDGMFADLADPGHTGPAPDPAPPPPGYRRTRLDAEAETPEEGS